MSKYSPRFIRQVRTWYIDEGKSDAQIAALAAKLPVRVILTRNAVIGLRQRQNPPIIRPPMVEAMRRVHHGQQHGGRASPVGRYTADDSARDRVTKPAPPASRPALEPVRRPIPAPIQTPAAPPPYRTKSALATRAGPTLLELEVGQCRNPVGAEPARPALQMFCGDRVQYVDRERTKGHVETVPDVYCAGCAARNRVGTSSPSALSRSLRAFS